MKYNAKGTVHFCQNQGIRKLWNALSLSPQISVNRDWPWSRKINELEGQETSAQVMYHEHIRKGTVAHRFLEAVGQPAVPQDSEHRRWGVLQVLESIHEDEVQHNVKEAHACHLQKGMLGLELLWLWGAVQHT